MNVESTRIELLIKWNKETIPVIVNENESLESFRGIVYSLTHVQPEKQKIIYKGKVLKESNTTLIASGISNVN